MRQTNMTICAPYRAILLPIFAGLLSILVTACSPVDSATLKWKQGLFLRMQGNLSAPITTRVQLMPADILKATQDDDRSIGIAHAERYAPRAATASELALIQSYIELLPHVQQTLFAKKLVAVYLIDGFSGAGITEWVADREGHAYYYLILNTALFTTSLDDWLTYKENSPFDKQFASPAIQVRTQTNFKALMYALLHEGTHIADYELGITPYLDPQHRRFSGRTREVSEFTDGIWGQRFQPAARYDFKHRGDLNTYGIFPQRGLIPRSDLSEMFSQLTKTPFVSFYSSTSWNEDLADYVTYRHIERKLGGAMTMELLHEGNVIGRYSPLKSALSKQREQAVRVFND